MERAQHAKEQIEYMTDKIPMKCCGTLAEFADMAVFFVSPGSGFATAFTFDPSADRSISE
jgi:hypothetical protein